MIDKRVMHGADERVHRLIAEDAQLGIHPEECVFADQLPEPDRRGALLGGDYLVHVECDGHAANANTATSTPRALLPVAGIRERNHRASAPVRVMA
jgi:hypothetical protein